MGIRDSKTSWPRNRGWHLVRVAIAALLLTASSLKCWQLATEPVIGTNRLLDSRWLLIATVEFELFFGIWLLADIWAKPTWATALACFSVFTCVSLCKAISGHASCGCFGRMSVNPWYTGMLDLLAVCSLLRWRPKESLFAIRRAMAVMILWLLIGIPAAFAMANCSPAIFNDTGDTIGNGKIVLLEPEKWVGNRFPLLDYIDINDKLTTGKWLILLYHHDCPKCRTAIQDLQKTANQRDCCQVALIELPPYGAKYDISTESLRVVRGQLTSTKEWFAETPLLLLLVDSRVVSWTSEDDQGGSIWSIEMWNVP